MKYKIYSYNSDKSEVISFNHALKWIVRSFVPLLAYASSFMLLSAGSANAAILTVNCAAGPFVSIGGAVAAAVNGDTIMVEACAVPYAENVAIAGFTGLHVVGVTRPNAAGGGDIGAKPAGVGVVVDSQTVMTGAGLAGPCFSIDDSTDVKIQNISMIDCTLGGVRVRSSKQVLILANRILRTSATGIGVLAINTDNLQISSNLIGFTGQDAVQLNDTRLTTVADNFIGRAGSAGIRLIDGANNRVDNNDVRVTGVQGLIVSGVEARIERNSISLGPAALANILVDAASFNADIVGNSVPSGINNAGAGTELASNF